jgi:DNA adenine methylase
MTKIRPFLKWAGGKYNCLEEVLQALPKGHRLVEPFAGSGVVFMNADFSSYLLGEGNADLIHLYGVLKQYGASFIDACQQYFQPQFNQKEVYYSLRERFNALELSSLSDKPIATLGSLLKQQPLASNIEKACLFLYLNRHGYNGLCRYNSSGIYNVPFGLYPRPYFPLKELLAFYQKSQKAEFVHADFRTTFMNVKPGDVVYCDPPYVPYSETSKPFAYTHLPFGLDAQIELAALARQSAARGVPVVISNHDTAFIRQHYEGADIKSFSVARWINCKANHRLPVKEIIAVFR